MAILTCYWPAWACDEARAQGLEGQPIDAFFGGQDQSSALRGRVAVGDTVVAVTVRAGAVFLLASLRVTSTAADALAWLVQHPEHAVFRFSRQGAQVVAGTGEAPLSFARRSALPPSPALRRVQVLEPAVARQVLAQLATPLPAAPTDAKADRLMATLRAAPGDEASAQVLADRWQDKGDVRGELMSLELALARAAVPEVPPLWSRLEAVLRTLAGRAALLRPGGFPFREVLAHRAHLGFRLRARTHAPFALDEALRWLAPWAFVQRLRLQDGGARQARTATYAEARLNRLDGARLTLVELLVRFPDSQVLLPFQSGPFLEPSRSCLTLLDARNLELSCVLPFLDDGPLPRAVLERARAALSAHQVEHQALTLHTWDGRVPRHVELEP